MGMTEAVCTSGLVHSDHLFHSDPAPSGLRRTLIASALCAVPQQAIRDIIGAVRMQENAALYLHVVVRRIRSE